MRFQLPLQFLARYCFPVSPGACAALLILTLLQACSSLPAEGDGSIPSGFVELVTAAPDQQPPIATDVRYFSTDNFLGTRVDGYQAAKIYITREAAQALYRVQSELNELGFGLKVFDAYRPQPAVDHFVRWAEDLDDTRMKQRYYPLVDKENLFRDGYISARSGHSRGSTVDLTIIDLETGRELDMGSPWDYFDTSSWPDSTAVNPQQRANRLLLRSVMIKQGFSPIRTEWWHFGLVGEPYPQTFFEFPVR